MSTAGGAEHVIRIGDAEVGGNARCYLIAEVGSNHNRDLDLARRLIDEAAAAGVDAVKFQTFSGRALYSTKTPTFDYLDDARPAHELLESIALRGVGSPCSRSIVVTAGVEFLSSPFDLEAVAELDEIGVAAFKVASFEIVDLPFIEAIGRTRRPIILSTGMATFEEISEAMEAARRGGTTEIALLQCASLYPAPPSAINLRAMDSMRARFSVPVGLSDHTLGTHIAVAGVARGADLLEKHVTLDRTLPGPDHAFAIEPAELRDLVRHVRDAEAALGDGRKDGPTDGEAVEMYTKARRSVVAACAIPAGTVVTAEMLTVKRPGFGVKPKYLPDLVGRVAAVDIDEDDIISWDLL